MLEQGTTGSQANGSASGPPPLPPPPPLPTAEPARKTQPAAAVETLPAAAPPPMPASPAGSQTAKRPPTTRKPPEPQTGDDTSSALDELEPFAGTGPSWQQSLGAFAASALFNGAILVVMSLFMMPEVMQDVLPDFLVPPEEEIVEPEIEVVEQPVTLDESVLDENPLESPVLTQSETDAEDDFNLDLNELDPSLIAETDQGPSLNIDNIKDIAGGRSKAARQAMLQERGGNSASDAAVAGGLAWLASVQQRNGSWSFSNIGKSSQPGTLKECENGATAMALMAFLGAGHTHLKEGRYQDTVKRGINFLLASNKPTATGLDFRGKVVANEGMYVQGLVGICLAEAYGMTKDRRLRRAAEGCLRYIMYTQDPKGGGWRYQPHQPGDTSVVGWMVMALKSGYFAKIPVERRITSGVVHFLDSVQFEEGAKYGYVPGNKNAKPSTTAIGLLCRMYLGWKNTRPALIEGVKYLGKRGPATNDMYYNYYATQVMIQHTNARGPLWEKWNTQMRDQLIRTQRKSGPEKGSWNVADTHGSRGGRLYMTCLAVMTLEVYYRVLPLYKRNSVQEEF